MEIWCKLYLHNPKYLSEWLLDCIGRFYTCYFFTEAYCTLFFASEPELQGVYERPVCNHLSLTGVVLGCRGGTRTLDFQSMSLTSYQLLYPAILCKGSERTPSEREIQGTSKTHSLWLHYSTRSEVCQVLISRGLRLPQRECRRDSLNWWDR